MSKRLQSRNAIWVVLGVALIARLIAYFISSHRNASAMGAMIIFCDLAIGYVIYLLGKIALANKGLGDNAWPLVMAALWLFNPVVLFISSSTGLIEPIFVLLILLTAFLLKGKVYSSVLVLILPVMFQLRNWLDGVDYGALSAFNFFALIGGMNRPLETVFLGFPYYIWGAVFVLFIVAGAALALFADFQRGSKNYYFIIGTYFIILFVFSTGMQARALFPGLVFLLVHFMERRDGRVLGLYFAFSASLLINGYQMLGIGDQWFHFSRDFMILISTLNIALAIAMVLVLIKSIWPSYKWMAPPSEGRDTIPIKYYIWIMLALGFLIRVIAVVHIDYGFGFDIGQFTGWSTILYEDGFAAFYGHPDFHLTDYPPAYLYVLYFLGWLRHYFEWERGSNAFIFFIFLPAILCDLGIGYVLHRRAEKSQRDYSRPKMPTLLTAFWIFNPAIILISSVWGQVESVFVLLLLLSLLLLREKKLLSSYILFGIAILTKPQSLFLGPVYLFSAIDYLQETKFSLKGIAWLGGCILFAMALMILMFVPFDLERAVRFFFDGLGLRPYSTVNAFNFFSLIGGSFRPMTYRFAGIPYGFMGMTVMLLLVGGTMAALFADRKRGGNNYFLIVGSLFSLIYIFSFRMLDRYMFPALPFLILAAIEKRDRKVLAIYVGLSVTFFYNCLEILHWVRRMEIRYDVVRAISASNVILGCFLLYVVISSVWPRKAIDLKGEAECTSS
ncbi:MAG: glycosyltransferase 87 family protein [Defluviitaleaceae bacterium]|nr:glycosyltransferase 87 family protein [Defluviitaleaceae bacterium]